MTLVRVKQNFQITLPAEVRKHLNIAQGDFLEATIRDNEIVLTPKSLVDRALDLPDQEHKETEAVHT
jgi:AbrB family looped-hinge helix DNA binding protein